MSSSSARQDGASGMMTSRKLYKTKPFRIGLAAGMTKSRVFEPDLFFVKQWDQIFYERGYHFSSYLKGKGVRLKSVPSVPTAEIMAYLNSATRERAIL